MAVRLRVQLGFAPPGDGPVRFWWQPPQGAGTIAELLQTLGTDLGLDPSLRSRLAATMDGFVVLGSSRTDLLRDSDTLLVSLGNKRGLVGGEAAGEDDAVQQPAAKRHKPHMQPAATPESSSSEEESSSSGEDEEESGSSEGESSSSEEEEGSSSEEEGSVQEQDVQTPAAPAPADDQATTGKRPSRSARRKAAKRRLRRMGVLPAGKRAAAAAVVQAAAPAVAAVQAAAPAAAAAKPQPASAPSEKRPTPAAAKAPAPVVQAAAPAARRQQQQGQQQGQQLPEVVVSAEWQPGGGKRQGQQQQQRARKQQASQQQQSGFHAVPPPNALPNAAAPAVVPAPQPPMTEAAFGRLALLEGEPTVGDVLAYRLLEIGADLQPVVSEVRCGRVTEVSPPAITLAPHPNPGVHPLAYQRALRHAQRLAAAAAAGEEDEGAEEDSDAEEPGSQYDEDGLLTAELASFVELRMMQPASGGRSKQPAAAATAAATAQQVADIATRPAAPLAMTAQAAASGGTADESLGPSNYSQLGPPRPASRGAVIAAEGGWASLYEQLRQRRAQLAGQAAEAAGQPDVAGVEAGTPSAPARQPGSSGAKAVQSAPPATRRERSNGAVGRGGPGPSSLTPGATRPRAGVRRTALGPMLRMLRESQELS